jgi:peptidyl-tRNA hydrolase, PTH1 family
MKLIVGLGNPGKKYEATRHNAGFWWVDAIARERGAAFRRETRFHGDVAKVSANGQDIWLVKPSTYMNESGRSVGALAAFYRIDAADVLVAHDELDLPPGGVRLKFGGGLSGHNGLKDIAACLNSRDFWRLRLGIGHPRDYVESGQEPVDYVLHAPRLEEQKAIEQAMESALALWPQIASGDTQGAMLKLHTKPKAAGTDSPG